VSKYKKFELYSGKISFYTGEIDTLIDMMDLDEYSDPRHMFVLDKIDCALKARNAYVAMIHLLDDQLAKSNLDRCMYLKVEFPAISDINGERYVQRTYCNTKPDYLLELE
jgi:hypothetical protein